MKYVGCVMADHHGGTFAVISIILQSHRCSEFSTISLGKGKCTALCQIDHASNGRRPCVANASDQTRGPAKKTDEQKARRSARLSHHNKQRAKRQLSK